MRRGWQGAMCMAKGLEDLIYTKQTNIIGHCGKPV